MKKSAVSAALLLIGLTLAGCPVYDDSDVGCFDDYDCPGGYVCDAPTGACVNASHGSTGCTTPDDCGTNETCSRSGSCEIGDCHFASIGCVRGFECSSASGRWECVDANEGYGAGGSPGGVTPGASSGGEPSSSVGGAAESPSAAGAAG